MFDGFCYKHDAMERFEIGCDGIPFHTYFTPATFDAPAELETCEDGLIASCPPPEVPDDDEWDSVGESIWYAARASVWNLVRASVRKKQNSHVATQ